MDDDTRVPVGEGPTPAWCNPIRAKDLLGMTAILVKDALENNHSELRESWGVRPVEAARSLHYAELASLPAWDAEVLSEAAGVASDGELSRLRRRLADSTRDVDKEMWANQLSNREIEGKQLARRVRLGILSEQLSEIVNPAHGVLFLRSIGIDVDFELLEAVAVITLHADTDEAAELYRELMRLPVLNPTSHCAVEAPIVSGIDSAEQSPKERRAAIDPASRRGAPRRVLEEWDAIEREYGPTPDANQVWRVLARNKDEKTPDKKTVHNILGDFRKQRLIP